jgi:hypothetical protein
MWRGISSSYRLTLSCAHLTVSVGLAVAAALHVGPARAQDPSFADFPYLIYCEYEGIASTYYFSQVGPDGRAIYMTLDRQVGVISIDGVAERVDGDRPGTCLDKTIDDLRAAGQAFDLL